MPRTDTTPDRPTFTEILEELVDLTAGVGVMLLPVLILAVPGIILFVVLPGLLLLAVAVPLTAIGALIAAPPYLVVRFVRQRRSRSRSAPAVAVPSPSLTAERA